MAGGSRAARSSGNCRHLAVTVPLLVLAVAALAGCGGGQEAGSRCEHLHAGPAYLACMNGEPYPAHHQTGTAHTASAPPQGVGGPLTFVGTLTGSGHGTTFVDRYSAGPLLYGKDEAPPGALLSACDYTRPQQIDSSVFIRGLLKVTYREGSLPMTIPTATEVLGGAETEATGLALRFDGAWQCSELVGTGFEFQPGETQTFPFWLILPGVLTNEQPQMPKEDINSWYLGFFGQQLGLQEVAVAGPGKAWCEEGYIKEWRLLLYNRSGHC